MIKIKERKSWIALLALLLLFAACKGESPTAPPAGGGTPPGGTTPPAGASLALAASNTSPLIDSTVVITATVTENGQPVANGTAIEFVVTGGTFTDVTPAVTALIRTTTAGVATVNLTSSTPGLARVTATVNNVTRSIDVTFRTTPPCVPPDPRCPQVTTPTISSVVPPVGKPTGGETVRINGTNFIEPVKVLFDIGTGIPVEVIKTNVTSTTIDVITPAVNIGAAQQLIADIIVITKVGATNEERAVGNDLFTFRNDVLTPLIHSLSPTSGPINGGTRVTISGTGFQAPVQVFFGSAEAHVVNTQFTQILVEAPDGRSTNPNGSGSVLGPVDVRVVNINSNTRATSPEQFRYVAKMQITAVGPTEGSFTGGTRVRIDGVGFDAPVAVTIGGVVATPVSVNGTEVVAITSALRNPACGDSGGPVSVTNIENGDSASGPTFTFTVPKPIVLSVSPTTVTAGGSVTVKVLNAQAGVGRITIGGKTAVITGEIFNGDGTADLAVTVPTNFTFATEPCVDINGIAGVRRLPLTVSITYTNLVTTCAATLPDGLDVNPTDTSCVVPPPPNAVITPTTPPCVSMGNVVAAGTATGSAIFTITNTGGRPLIISSVNVFASSNTTTVTVAPTSATLAPQASQTFTVTADPAAVGPFSGTIRVNSNDPDTPTIDFCFDGNGT